MVRGRRVARTASGPGLLRRRVPVGRRPRVSSPRHMQALKQTAATQVMILIGCVALASAVELVDQVAFRGSLERFGIHPRDVAALWGILAAPVLHVGWVHLVANTGPFVITGWLVMLRRLRDVL